MPTRAPSRVIDRALFWNGLCVGLIIAAVVTAFIDLIPTEVSIGLCVLGVLAGLIGVPLYISQAIADWRSARPSSSAQSESAAVAGESEDEAVVATPSEGESLPKAEVPPEVEVQPELPAGRQDDKEAGSSQDAAPERCTCHGLPVHD